MGKRQILFAAGLTAVLLAFAFMSFMPDSKVISTSKKDDRISPIAQKNDRVSEPMQPTTMDTKDFSQPRNAKFVGDEELQRVVLEQREARQSQTKSALDKQFDIQPTDPKWSLESMRAIENSLHADNLKEMGASPPIEANIDCRNTMCRIHLVYSDSGSASDAGTMVNMAIAERMPYTQTLRQPRPNGGVDYFIYATRDPITLPR